jgi:hypothetical protein
VALTAEAAYKGLMDHGFITRWLPGQGLPQCLRITIGAEELDRSRRRAAPDGRSRAMSGPAPFTRVAVIGLGLLGGSVTRGVHAHLPDAITTGFDADPAVRARAREIGLANFIPDTVAEAVTGADLVVLCVPVGAMAAAGASIAEHLPPGVIVTDVGSSKASVAEVLGRSSAGRPAMIPAPPGCRHRTERPRCRALPRCSITAGASSRPPPAQTAKVKSRGSRRSGKHSARGWN